MKEYLKEDDGEKDDNNKVPLTTHVNRMLDSIIAPDTSEAAGTDNMTAILIKF